MEALLQKSEALAGRVQNRFKRYLWVIISTIWNRRLYPAGISIVAMQKPEKIYLDNPNLAFALSNSVPDQGNLRETFFLSQLVVGRRVSYPSQGDYYVNGKWIFDVDGRMSSFLPLLRS